MYINILVTCGVITCNDSFVLPACLVSVMTFVGLWVLPNDCTKMMLEKC